MTGPDAFRPRLALPYTVVPGPGRVDLVAGEDHRYALAGADLETWLPPLLAACDGRRTEAEMLETLEPARREAAAGLLGRLRAERVLVDGSAAEAWASTGRPRSEVRVFRQDALDYAAAVTFGREARREGRPWIWATTGPLARAYASPVFLPGAGPCVECLISVFVRISPAPDVYRRLFDHAAAGGEIAPSPFPAEGVEVLEALVRWKADRLALDLPPAAVFRLHVVEASTLEVSTHRVPRDPWCPSC